MRSIFAATLRSALIGLSEAEARDGLVATLSSEDAERFLHDWQVWARDDQLPPASDAWVTWLLLGGRGAGKTRAGAEWVRAQALGLAPLAAEPAMRIALIGETLADARAVMVEGASGLLSVHRGRGERPVFEPTNRRLVWPNGAMAQLSRRKTPTACAGRSSSPPGRTSSPSGVTPNAPGTCCNSRCAWATGRARS